jgi:mono/diheme cytochrome c family protein
MRHVYAASAVLAALAVTGASAQQPPLDDTQRLGQSLFVQSCGVCHLKPQLTSVQFAPVLSRESLGGQEDVMRQVIANGTPRMPGFKYHFKPEQIDAIVAYLQTVPNAPSPSGPAR